MVGMVVQTGPSDGPPHRLGLRLHPRHGIDDQNRPVQHGHAPIDLDTKVHVAGRIDQMDRHIVALVVVIPDHVVVPSPIEGDGGTLDGNPAFPLGGQIIRDGVAGIDRPGPTDDAGQGQHAFGDGGLAGVDVGQDAHVAQVGEPMDLQGGCGELFRFAAVLGRGAEVVQIQGRGCTSGC